MISHGKPPFLECSSSGDRRFSAFFVRIKAREDRSIEDLYQAAKVFADGRTGLRWREAKGRKPTNAEACKAFYGVLWEDYIGENPELLEVLIAASGVSDIFGQLGHVCHGTELWRIRCRKMAIRDEIERG